MENKLVTEKLGKDLKVGDTIWITGGDTYYFDHLTDLKLAYICSEFEVYEDFEKAKFLCLVSTKEAKDAEDWLKEKGLFDQTDRLKHIPMLNELSDLLTEFADSLLGKVGYPNSEWVEPSEDEIKAVLKVERTGSNNKCLMAYNCADETTQSRITGAKWAIKRMKELNPSPPINKSLNQSK